MSHSAPHRLNCKECPLRILQYCLVISIRNPRHWDYLHKLQECRKLLPFAKVKDWTIATLLLMSNLHKQIRDLIFFFPHLAVKKQQWCTLAVWRRRRWDWCSKSNNLSVLGGGFKVTHAKSLNVASNDKEMRQRVVYVVIGTLVTHLHIPLCSHLGAVSKEPVSPWRLENGVRAPCDSVSRMPQVFVTCLILRKTMLRSIFMTSLKLVAQGSRELQDTSALPSPWPSKGPENPKTCSTPTHVTKA